MILGSEVGVKADRKITQSAAKATGIKDKRSGLQLEQFNCRREVQTMTNFSLNTPAEIVLLASFDIFLA